MPIYLYECPKCGHRLELLRSINDPNPFCRCKVDAKTNDEFKAKLEKEPTEMIKIINFQGRVNGNYGTKNS